MMQSMVPSVSDRLPSLKRVYHRLLQVLGPQQWWPAKSPFEVMVGAILTQATNWHNAEHAITKLKAARVLSARRVAHLSAARLKRLVRSSGYFRQKAERLQALSRWYLARYGANSRRMFQTDPWQLREELLDVPGIGPETADTILLYAGHQPVFVVDAYTRRIFRRHHLLEGDEAYETIQRVVMDRLPDNPTLFNEFHALLVAVGKGYCHRRDPECRQCPLVEFPHHLERSHHG